MKLLHEYTGYLCFITYSFVFFFWCEKFGHTTCSKFGKKVQFYSSPCLQSLSFGKVRITGMMMRPSTQVEEGRRQDTMGWNMFLNFVKGQLISKGLFAILNSSKKWKKQFDHSTNRKKNLNLFVRFLLESLAWKTYFERFCLTFIWLNWHFH